MKERKVFIVGGKPVQGLARKEILEKIQERRKRGLSVYELSWVIGTDIFVILKALKRDLISVRTRYTVHWCYPLREVASWIT